MMPIAILSLNPSRGSLWLVYKSHTFFVPQTLCPSGAMP